MDIVYVSLRSLCLAALLGGIWCCEPFGPDPGAVDAGVIYTVSLGAHIDTVQQLGRFNIDADVCRILSQYNREFCNVSQFLAQEVQCDVVLRPSPSLNIFGVPEDGGDIVLTEDARRDRQCGRDDSGFGATFLVYNGFIPATLAYGVTVQGCNSAVVRSAAFQEAPDVLHHEFGHLAGYNGGGPGGHEPARVCDGNRGRVFMCPSGPQDVVFARHCTQLKR